MLVSQLLISAHLHHNDLFVMLAFFLLLSFIVDQSTIKEAKSFYKKTDLKNFVYTDNEGILIAIPNFDE